MADHSNISSLITQLAQSHPQQAAVIVDGQALSFQALEAEIETLAAELQQTGITPGMKVALMVPPSFAFVSLTFALFRMGAVIVLIDPGIGVKNMGNCLAESEPEAFIGIPKAHIARLLFGWAKKSLKHWIVIGNSWPLGGPLVGWARFVCPRDEVWWAKKHAHPTTASSDGTSDIAAILFTSGSTGAPKGVIYTHAMFMAQTRMLQQYFKIQAGGHSVPTFPLFALFDVALGLSVVIPKMDFTRPASVDPQMLSQLIEQYQAEQLFGSPALLDTLSRYGEKSGVKLPSLKRVISCGAPVSATVIARVKKMLPADTPLFTPYGATESLPVACISSEELAQLPPDLPGVCVGDTWQGMQSWVIKITDEPITQWSDELVLDNGKIGEIVVRGPVVSAAYFARESSTALAKIHGPNGELYHRMGDVGWKDQQGRLWFCGRKGHRVTTTQGPMFTIPCEAVFNKHPDVRRTALVGIGPAGQQTPVLCVELEAGHSQRPALRDELLALGAANPLTLSIKHILYHPKFPVDIRHNAKISREKLAAWAAEQGIKA